MNNYLRAVLAISAVILLSTGSALHGAKEGGKSAQPTPAGSEMERDSRRLMEVSGATRNALAGLEHGLALERRINPNLPEEFFDEFRKAANSEDFEKVFAPIYADTFTHEEIKALIAFYESPLGRRLVAATPGLIQRCTLAGQAWGAATGARIMKDLAAKGEAKCGESEAPCPEEERKGNAPKKKAKTIPGGN